MANLTSWMITEGRCSGDAEKVVSHFCSALVEAGVPIWRVNIGQRFSNPLFFAWGVVWTPAGARSYDIEHQTMLSDGYIGSSFDYILKHEKPLHKSLRGLDPETDHISYLEFAESGGTDYYATLLYYGDGSLHGCTFLTKSAAGFSPAHIETIEAALPALCSAIEPITMRRSSRSLLRGYLGAGPSDAVWNGTITRGERKTIEAVVMFSDLRDFTAMSESSSEEDLFDALNGFFDLIVQAVEDNGGDVLKFMGDGVLAIFEVTSDADRSRQCEKAVRAAQDVLWGLAALNDSRVGAKKRALDCGIGINLGEVSYGNIGSPGRLDFTVLGGAVNVASRIETLTKKTGHRVLATSSVAGAVPNMFSSCGCHEIRGLADPIELYALNESPL